MNMYHYTKEEWRHTYMPGCLIFCQILGAERAANHPMCSLHRTVWYFADDNYLCCMLAADKDSRTPTLSFCFAHQCSCLAVSHNLSGMFLSLDAVFFVSVDRYKDIEKMSTKVSIPGALFPLHFIPSRSYEHYCN
jgi:hypothetical protein